MDTIYSEIIEILKRYMFNKDLVNTINKDSKLLIDLKINSARIVDIVLDVEEKYNIEITNDELKRIITISDIIEQIYTKTSKD